jgi:hypothetical protein
MICGTIQPYPLATFVTQGKRTNDQGLSPAAGLSLTAVP